MIKKSINSFLLTFYTSNYSLLICQLSQFAIEFYLEINHNTLINVYIFKKEILIILNLTKKNQQQRSCKGLVLKQYERKFSAVHCSMKKCVCVCVCIPCGSLENICCSKSKISSVTYIFQLILQFNSNSGIQLCKNLLIRHTIINAVFSFQNNKFTVMTDAGAEEIQKIIQNYFII